MEYAFYVGCTIPSRGLHQEYSARKVLTTLGVELDDMQDTNCCGPFTLQSVDYESWLALATRNICIGEEMGKDILTLCNDCYESLLMAKQILEEDEEVRDRVNDILSDICKEFKGSVKVRHIVEVLYEDVGLEKIKAAVTNPLTNLRVGTQAGCHLVRPRRLHYGFEEGFEMLDEIVRATGAEVVNYDYQEDCCGGPLKFMKDELSTELVKQKLVNLKRAGVDCVVSVCPFCYIRFDLGQIQIRRRFKEKYDLPVLYLMELLSLAMGIELVESRISWHKIKLDEVLKQLA